MSKNVSLAKIMPSQMMINDFLKIYHHGTLMMLQFILKRANTFENKIISRENHFRRMILSFLMMMTSGFSGITGN